MTPENAMRQAALTADVYMMEAHKAIDALFEKGYAKTHPGLVAAFMNVAASDFSESMKNNRHEERMQNGGF